MIEINSPWVLLVIYVAVDFLLYLIYHTPSFVMRIIKRRTKSKTENSALDSVVIDYGIKPPVTNPTALPKPFDITKKLENKLETYN